MTKAAPVYWITGLSGSGKSTLCSNLSDYLRGQGVSIVKLDGDELREVLGATDAHDRESRIELAKRYSKLCRLLSIQGISVAISTISLFHEIHEWNRQNIPGYIEVYLDVPLEELKRRDPKKIYERAENGEIVNVAGMDLEIDQPVNPDVILNHDPAKNSDDVFMNLKNSLEL